MNALATSPRALQWGPGVATPPPRVKLNTAVSGGSTPLQTALAHKTQNGQKKVSPQTVQVLPMSWTKYVTYVLTQPFHFLAFSLQPSAFAFHLSSACLYVATSPCHSEPLPGVNTLYLQSNGRRRLHRVSIPVYPTERRLQFDAVRDFRQTDERANGLRDSVEPANNSTGRTKQLSLEKPCSIRKVAFLGDYLPRKCGIATFTTDL